MPKKVQELLKELDLELNLSGSLDELRLQQTQLTEVRSTLRVAAQQIADAIETKQTEVRLRDLVAGLSDTELEKLAEHFREKK